MTTLLAVFRRSRTHVHGVAVTALCDERCYSAMLPSQLKEPRRSACRCICGGANHAAGFAKALKNVQQGVGLTELAMSSFAEVRKLERDSFVVVDRLRVLDPNRARKLAGELMNPRPLLPGEDLFACEEVT